MNAFTLLCSRPARRLSLGIAIAIALLGGLTPVVGFARPPVAAVPAWPDSYVARLQALALLQSFNADLLSHDSATLTLERWCGTHQLAPQAKIVAKRVLGQDKPLPDDLRAQLGISADEPVRYRRVQLMCGGHVLSEADNWYLPNRLTAAMNQQLEHSDVPFGRVVLPLHFRRKTLSAELLWSPLPSGWEMGAPVATDASKTLPVPAQVLQHSAVLYRGDDNRPFSAVRETYTGEVLAFPLKTPAAAP